MSKFTTTHDPEWSIEDYAAKVGLEYDPKATPGMVWVDVETTGLPKEGPTKLLELAMALTDDDGVLIDVFQTFVYDLPTYEVIRRMNDFVKKMHDESGFMAEWEKYIEDPDMPSFDIDKASDYALEWLEYHHLLREPNTFEMCGNSIHFDRRLLEREMPTLENWFFRRNIDVSSIKQLCKRHNPRIYSHYENEIVPAIKAHRALLDIAVSIKEYRYYVDNFFWVHK